MFERVALSIAAIGCIISQTTALSITESPRAEIARLRLADAFRSPSGKITLHPELVLPEPSDPTALLLRSTEVTKLSTTLRTKAKANGLFVEGSIDALAPLGKEQESARGNFPGPVPIICSMSNVDDVDSERLESMANIDGVEGVLIPFCVAKGINSVDSYVETINDGQLAKVCAEIWSAGMQPIPEILLAKGSQWAEDEVVRLIDAVKDTCGGLDPVSIVFTKEESEQEDEESDDLSTPEITIPESIEDRLAFVGSVRTTAGGGRMNQAISQLSSCNFNAAFLRADCVPGYRMNPDLNVVGGFWAAALGDLKSLKSKNFNFRSKVKLDRDVPMEWYNYQKDVMESGALGSSGAGADPTLNPDAGDYKGF
ncbi:hypothetical protein ACHAWO_005598 [Cyclotella atomus]|uniref:Fructose-bisphosphate aldolase n=1 Tax=Cyclotella atomus TaxID=382360 RepID=A0ABD3QUJ6_9STRA